MIDAFELDERRSAGKVLDLGNPPWGVRKPTDPNHPVDPILPRQQNLDDQALARELAAAILATMPDAMRQQATAAYQASQEAGRALNEAIAEYTSLQAPAPAGLSVEQRGARLNRRAGLEGYIEELRQQVAATGAACTVALADIRFEVEHYAGRAVVDQERARIREMRDEAERLEAAADHRQIALQSALSQVANWLPTEPPRAPVQAAPIVEPAKRKRLFS